MDTPTIQDQQFIFRLLSSRPRPKLMPAKELANRLLKVLRMEKQ